MSLPRCPRCHREAPGSMVFCAGCGAPLLLGDEAPTAPVDAPVDLDRRGRARPGPRADELADVERSHWDLGSIADWDLGMIAGAGLRKEPLPAAPGDVAAAEEALARNVVAAAGAREKNAVPAKGVGEKNVVAAEPSLGEMPSTSTTTSTSEATLVTATENALADAGGHAAAASDGAGLDDLPDPDLDVLEVHVARAEPWRRVIGWLVDGVPFVAGGTWLVFLLLREAAARGGPPRVLEDVLDLVSAERVIVLSVAAAVALALAVYATLAHALGGATLGKRLVGIRVVGPDGGAPSPARSAIRACFAIISASLLGLGFILALFTRTGRALHDVLARTWVVKAP